MTASASALQDFFELFAILVENFFRRPLGRPRFIALAATGWRIGGCASLIPQRAEIAPVKPEQKSDQPDNQRKKNKEDQRPQPAALLALSLCHSQRRATRTEILIIRLVLEIMGRIDDPNGFCPGAHDHGLRSRAAGKKVHAAQVVAIGHPGGGEHHIAGS